MKEQLLLQKILITKFEELRVKNSHYSRRAFSKKLGISAGAISELFNGQRNVSAKLAERIADRLELDPQERSELLGPFHGNKRHSNRQDPSSYTTGGLSYLQLSADQFQVIADWYHFAFLTLMRTKDFRTDVLWIAARLGLTPALVQGAIDRLKRVGLVQETNGVLNRAKASHRTSDDIVNLSVRRAHFQYLDKAREALESLSVHERDFTSLILTLSPEDLPKAKEMIRKFQDELSRSLETDTQSEVFQLCIQLFPLTRSLKEQEIFSPTPQKREIT
jgi:uncharacterized protein (TIGR02147 family)